MNYMETERLILREFRKTDYEDILEQVYGDRAVWGLYSGIGDDPEEIRRRFTHRCYQPGSAEFGFRLVELKATGRAIGQVHLEPHVLDPRTMDPASTARFDTIEVELAFAFGKAYWGQGLAYEACLAMIDYAFRTLKLPRLVGGAYRTNERSIRLHRRLGYTIAPDGTDPNFVCAILENHLLDAPMDSAALAG